MLRNHRMKARIAKKITKIAEIPKFWNVVDPGVERSFETRICIRRFALKIRTFPSLKDWSNRRQARLVGTRSSRGGMLTKKNL